VCDLAWIVGRDEKLVSHHARALRVAGLAGATRDGKLVMYELTDRGRALEGFASVIIIWRFTGSRVLSQTAEHRAQKLVAAQFFLLAPYVAFESVRALAGAEHPEVSVLGMALAVWSLITMPLLGIAKQRIAEEIGSAATKGEGRQNVLCAYLAGALLIGLAGNAVVGAWWLDPVVGLLIAAVAVKEGAEAWRGDGCCVGSPLDGYAAAEQCDDDCCR
jgi:hypothetical protein